MIGIFVLPGTPAAEWIDEHVHAEGWQWLGNTLWIDSRYAGDIVDGMAENGLTPPADYELLRG